MDSDTAVRQTRDICCSASRSASTGDRGSLSNEVSFAFSPSPVPVDHGFAQLDDVDFLMGGADRDAYPTDGEGPPRRVRCSPYSIATCAVSNAQFAHFIARTGYVTDAERFGWSYVFYLFVPESQRQSLLSPVGLPWWLQVDGASWAAPEGPGSKLDARMNHPVTHVSWFDAQAYCSWSRSRLPTEAEWEYAARGGLEGRRYAWGDVLEPDGRHRCNVWQGTFPDYNSGADGYLGTAPVDAYEPNGQGLYNVCGNVWEWCADWYTPNYHRVTRSLDPIYAVPRGNRSIRGGSFLCHSSWCNRYRVAARSSIAPDTSISHCGFRVVDRAATWKRPSGRPQEPSERR